MPSTGPPCRAVPEVGPGWRRHLHDRPATPYFHRYIYHPLHQARGSDNNPLPNHFPTPVKIHFHQFYLKTPVSTSLQDPPLLVVTWVTEAPTQKPEEAGALLAMNSARNSPICPTFTFPKPVGALHYRFSHTRCQQKNKNNTKRCTSFKVVAIPPGR